MIAKGTFQIILGNRIKKLRLQKKYSQRQLALQANKDPQSLERVENGKSCPTVFYLAEICEALEVTLVEFFECDDFKTVTTLIEDVN